jgi:hypothetical protein
MVSGRPRAGADWPPGLSAGMVCEARALGMQRVLVVFGAENTASAKTILRQGGILEDAAGRGAVLRYWIMPGGLST